MDELVSDDEYAADEGEGLTAPGGEAIAAADASTGAITEALDEVKVC